MTRKKTTVALAVVSLALVTAGGWWWQNRGAAPAGPAAAGSAPGGARPGSGTPSVETAIVKTTRLQDDAQAVGTLRSRQSVALKPETAGRVARIAFADGAAVKRGQVLVQLDDTLQKAELQQARAQLSIAQANLKRNQELVAQGFVAQRVVDESQAALDVAQAQVTLASARLQRMQIVAPFDGTVGLRTINLGQYVKDGDTLLNLEDTSVLTVDFRLPERFQDRIRPGQAVQVSLDALPGRRFEARVLAVDPLLDAEGRSISVRATMPPEAGRDLRPGMFARVLTVFSVNERAVVVPEEALVPQGGQQVVFVIEEQGEGDAKKRVSRRVPVEIGLRRGAEVEIVKGLRGGETVVIAGQQRLQRDGTAVRVIDVAGAGRPAAGAAPAAAAAAGAPAPAR